MIYDFAANIQHLFETTKEMQGKLATKANDITLDSSGIAGLDFKEGLFGDSLQPSRIPKLRTLRIKERNARYQNKLFW